MVSFTRNEQIDMLLIFGETRKNSSEAARLYAERFPGRRLPIRHYFSKLEQKMRTEPNEDAVNNYVVSEEKEIDVLSLVNINITASVREIAVECDISSSSVWRILHKYKYHAYKYQIHQHLYQNDHARRLEYCNWFLQRHQQDPTFPSKILYSDESRFTNLGMFNRHNKRYWSQDNLHLMEEGNFQERFGFNCWLGIIGDRIVGPIIFDGHLTGERYLGFLQVEIEQFLENLPVVEQMAIIFQQDGAPPHNSRAVREYLHNTYGENWIGTNGPIRWPARYFW